LAVVIGSLDQELAHRFYDRDFIESRRVDRFAITTKAGERYEFVYWGGDSCERAPPPAEGDALDSAGADDALDSAGADDDTTKSDPAAIKATTHDAMAGDAGADAQARPVLD
jgi:hypothetical protein